MSDELSYPVILFDGVCNFCNAGINFIMRQDKNKVFRFAALQSEAGQKLLAQYNLPRKEFESFVLIDEGKVYQKSSAGLKVYGKLPWYWKWTQVFWLAPKFIRNVVYDFIAKNRYRWFGKKEQCMIPMQEVRNRFLA
ncbi:thiol-disulfide oxidoreductase DCC family protein [Flavisolibacter ginsenosidimutans]|uniref:Thiol-disulfide oxidoreductase DCC family protein n=2 Tax=Flavisolibacter ginsenosidimutans TaxID=661481 RepID=A0A5B8UPI4_9BACT|nr:thiol-disulfide oxidoreductase DCC family protein [Flavisolibacter ginsenosidimutans]